MCSFVVLGFVFPYQAKRLAWERLRNDLFCVEWLVKPQSVSQSVSLVLSLVWSCEQVVGTERRYSRDSDSDEDIPDELRADFVDERTGDAPSPQKK